MEEIKKKINIYLLSGEKIYTIQRKHVISIVLPLASCILITFISIIAFFIIYRIYLAISLLSIIDAVLLVLSFLAAFSMFISMNWFYQFYVVTNMRILYIHFFRIQGQHFEEVYMTKGDEIKISRAANNLIYDILNAEDITLTFTAMIRPEPYIIQIPAHAKELEELLDQVAAGQAKEK